MQDFRDLKVWVKSHSLALAIYEGTAAFPREETYGLTSQIRRAATSIPTNLAEGCGNSSRAEFARFLQMALNSASELEYLLLLAHELKLLHAEAYEGLSANVVEVKRMLTAFIATLRPPRKSDLVSTDA